jgi:hypothetical protein
MIKLWNANKETMFYNNVIYRNQLLYNSSLLFIDRYNIFYLVLWSSKKKKKKKKKKPSDPGVYYEHVPNHLMRH